MDQVSAIAQVNDVLTGHPEDARYITGAQQRGLDPLHIHHRPSQTPKTQHDSPNATTFNGSPAGGQVRLRTLLLTSRSHSFRDEQRKRVFGAWRTWRLCPPKP